MHVELLGQLGQRPLALHGGEGHLRLEGRGAVPARSSRHRLSLPAAILAAVRQKLHSARLSRFPEPALSGAAPERREGGQDEALRQGGAPVTGSKVAASHPQRRQPPHTSASRKALKLLNLLGSLKNGQSRAQYPANGLPSLCP